MKHLYDERTGFIFHYKAVERALTLLRGRKFLQYTNKNNGNTLGNLWKDILFRIKCQFDNMNIKHSHSTDMDIHDLIVICVYMVANPEELFLKYAE